MYQDRQWWWPELVPRAWLRGLLQPVWAGLAADTCAAARSEVQWQGQGPTLGDLAVRVDL